MRERGSRFSKRSVVSALTMLLLALFALAGTVVGTGPPGPTGAAVELVAPDIVVRGGDIEVFASVIPTDPGDPIFTANLEIIGAGGEVLFSGPPTSSEPALGLVTWVFGSAETAVWIDGIAHLSADLALQSGPLPSAAVAVQVVAPNVVEVFVDGARVDGDTFGFD